jgi:hypothetical protein
MNCPRKYAPRLLLSCDALPIVGVN